MSKTRAAAKTRTRLQRRVVKEIRIGISGWRYAGWRGKFYPKGLPQYRELEFCSATFNSVEINGSFYSLQLPSSYQRWYHTTPRDFVFAVKGGRFITHMKKLRDVEIPLANFFASGVLALREKLGPILWQLPPNLSFDADRLKGFPRSASTRNLRGRTNREEARRQTEGSSIHEDRLLADASVRNRSSAPDLHGA